MLRQIRRCGDLLGFAAALVFFKLPPPTQGTGFGGDLFSLGDHSFLLIKDREARMSQFVIGSDFDESLAYFYGLIDFLLVRLGHGKRVQRIRVIGIFVKRVQIGDHGLFQSVLGEELHALIVIFFLIHDAYRFRDVD